MSPIQDPFPGPMAPDPGGALWRVLWGCLMAAGKIYVGPAVWSCFPKDFGFSVLSLCLALVANAINGLVSGADLRSVFLNGAVVGILGAIGLSVREEPPWASAVLFVMLLGILVDTPFELLKRIFASSAAWGGAEQVILALSTFLQVWMMVTVMRLAAAKISATHKIFPRK